MQGILRGSVHVDDATRRLFATDASLFRIKPLAVVAPVDEEDLLALVRYASAKQFSLTPRGGGTGLAGESLTSGIVVDLSRHFTSILEVKDDLVRVQPGVVAQQLNQALLPSGRRIAIDCASEASCTIGGMLATNASGARVVKHGYLRQYVDSVHAIVGTGQRVHLRPHSTRTGMVPTAEYQLAFELRQLIQLHTGTIDMCRPKTSFHRAGYLLHDLLHGQKIALQKTLVGSEGTLGFITEATIRTVPLPVERAVLLLGFAGMIEAADCVPSLLECLPSAIELLDRRLITMACEADPSFKRWLTPGMQAALLIEWEGNEPGSLLPLIEHAVAIIQKQAHPLIERLVMDPREADHLWSLRSKALPALHASAGRTPVAFVEDIAVPVESLSSFLSQVQQLVQQHGITASILSHAGAGIVHLRPMFDLHHPEEVQQLHAFADDIYAEVFKLGGTISAQHGVGLARTPWMARQAGPLLELYQQVKTLFDPNSIYNPGKFFAHMEPPLRHLRVDEERQPVESTSNAVSDSKAKPLPMIEWAMNWKNTSPLATSEACHGCGACRSVSPSQRMCPIFHAEKTEDASPRAKANLLRDILHHPEAQLSIDSDAVRDIADLCVNCKMCGIECPSKVTIPKLMLEAKAQNVLEQGLRWRDWVVAHLDTWASWGSRYSWLVNGMLGRSLVRWPLEKLLGITRRRRLPRLHYDVFLKRAQRFGWTTKPTATDRPRVLYFADTFAQYFDPDLGEATVRVLQAAGVQVYVPPAPMQSGAAALSVGYFSRAKRLAQRNINTLEPFTREGYSILCSEPTTALMLKQDYLDILDDPGAHQVARHTVELMAYLHHLDEQGRLPRTPMEAFPLKLGHHIPCHIKALQLGVHGPQLLESAAGLRVHTLDISCSGMAGVYGLQQANYASSLRAGKPMLDRFAKDDLHVGSSECSSCRIQMAHVGNKPVLHPVQWLAIAWNLMPELKERITSNLIPPESIIT